MKKDLLNNKDWLKQKYVEEKLNTVQIAEICKCSNVTVGECLKKFSIEIRPNNESKNPNANWNLLNNKDWLKQKYVEEKLNTYQIARICNCGYTTVNKHLKKFGIEIRDNNESQNTNANWTLLNNKDWLKQKYAEEKLSTRQIAEICNCGNTLVWNQLKIFGIEIRPNNESKNPNANWNLLNNKDWLKQKYVEEKLNTVQIAEICKCSNVTVGEYLKKFSIEIRDNKGENSHFWKGGISFEPYCYKFNDDIKEETRDNFNRVCFLCGKSEKENNNKRLSVHHVDYNKGQGCGHGWTLVPLCSSCHAKTNHNRHYWFNLLQNYWLFQDEITFYNINLFIPDEYPYKVVCEP